MTLPVADRQASILTPGGYDNTIRWRRGERLFDLFVRRCARLADEGRGTHPATEADGDAISYTDLLARVGQAAGYLAGRGVRAGDRIGLLLDRSIDAYVAMLAVVSLEAAYVPLDLKFPSDRISYIAEDAGIHAFVAVSAAAGLLAGVDADVITLEDLADGIAGGAPARPADAADATAGHAAAARVPDDRLAYIIYTSGSTGRPKGVGVNHSSICNFVSVAAEVYGYTGDDRVYQGLTFAFDFSVEELWVPLMAGATLVASPADVQLVGEGLREFLVEHRITALCCVPTLLATIESDVASLRFLLVSGEACPKDIVTRWHRPGRRMLNAYGPTEATVTATWTELHPDRRVTIGIPLPTYTIAILDPERPEIVTAGTMGEIAIAGIGLAQGYVNRDELTAAKFVPDFAGLPNNPSRRLYRTGDLGRINEDGEIEYFGRIDTQVKIKGYRIELSEIEAVLLEIDGVAQAVVTEWEAGTGRKELVAYYTVFDSRLAPSRDDVREALRLRLPAYMVPAYLEPLDEIPLLPSQKADRKALPAPRQPRLAGLSGDYVAPLTETERLVAETLAVVLDLERVSAEDSFFEQLGLDSLRVAELLSQLNRRLPKAKASIADVYLAPTVRELALTIDTKQVAEAPASRVAPACVADSFSHALCGTLQAASYVALYGLYAALAYAGFVWINAAQGAAEFLMRCVSYCGGSLVLLTLLPVAAKWLLVGRFRKDRVRLWSLAYFRFWLVRLLVESSPLAALRGTPLLNVYLRLLGARVGPGALILSKAFPVAADLIDIGDNAVLRKQSHATGYRAENGELLFGTITIGRDAIVGEGSLVGLNATVGAGAQLGHASALPDGQTIADHTRAHGSPALGCATDFAYLPSGAPPMWRRAAYGTAQALVLLLGYAGLLAFGVVLMGWLEPGSDGARAEAQAGGAIFARALFLSLVVFAVAYAVTFILHLVGTWLLKGVLRTGIVYPLYGLRYFAAQTLTWLSNSAGFHVLFGDSSYVVGYLRALGIRQPGVRQTGSNFGTSMQQDNPFACEIGSGTMVSDGLSLINYEVAANAFRVSETKLGPSSFVGNNVIYPPNARTGADCLYASKVMVPVDGGIRAGVGLLGSPAFEIPRAVPGREAFDPVPQTPQAMALLRRKDAYNLRTMGLYLASQWGLLFMLIWLALAATSAAATSGPWVGLLAAAAAPVIVVLYCLGLEWLSLGGERMRPHACTIHDPYFAWVERHWKLGEHPLKNAFRGTPFRPVVLRWLGVDIGARVFDDGSIITEKSLVRIADGACINADVSIQAHSLEDGLFKSDRITIGAHCSIGPMAYVHYGTRLGANTIVSSDAFVMKGTETAPFSRWSGNPATPV